MNNLNEFLVSNNTFVEMYKNTPINKIPLLGTHDSASYTLIHGNNNDKLTKILDYVRYLGCVDDIIKEWTLTQKYSIYHQLKLGIRALDLRITYDQNTKEFYFTHTLFCEKAQSVLLDINKYLDENNNSFLMVLIKPDFQHRQTFTQNVNDTFKKMIHDIFGSKLISRSNTFPTLNECLKKNQNILCAFTDESITNNFDWLWGGDLFQGGWIQETDDELFYQGLKNFVKYANNDYSVTHLSIAKTPTTDTIKEDIKNRFTKPLYIESKYTLIHHKICQCLYTPQNLYQYSLKQNDIYNRLKSDSISESFDMTHVTIWWIDYASDSKDLLYHPWD